MGPSAAGSSARSRRVLHYWRLTIHDRTLSRGVFDKADLNRDHTRVSAGELVDGLIRADVAEAVFAKAEGDNEGGELGDQVEVEIRPFLYIRKPDNKRPVPARYGAVSPIVARAWLGRDGRLSLPGQVSIPRQLLAPLGGDDAFDIGDLSDYHDVVASRWPDPGWSGFVRYWTELLEAVTGRPADQVPDGFRQGSYAAVIWSRPDTATARIATLYGHLARREGELPPLFERIASPSTEPSVDPPSALSTFTRRAGHGSATFGLAPSQRQVAGAVVDAVPGEVVAANGPPGTGKTTMVLSVVASQWVAAAVAGAEGPPLVVATSTNNNAVTNVLDAFAAMVGVGEDALSRRWLPDVDSYGSYFPAPTRKLESAGYHTEARFNDMESDSYVDRARAFYLNQAEAAYPELRAPSVDTIVDALHADLLATAAELEEVAVASTALATANHDLRARVADTVGSTNHLADLTETAARADWARVATALVELDANRSPWAALFSWWPGMTAKRLAQARLSVEPHWPDGLPVPDWASIDELRSDVGDWRAAADAVISGHQRVAALLGRLTAQSPDTGDLEAIDALCDVTLRHRLFLLAGRYWEGRWLQEMTGLAGRHEHLAGKTGRTTVEPRWRRRMMVTPCAVATLFTLPSLLEVSVRKGDGFVDDYLYEAIDLLIVDEAGQVAPEVSGAAFALAKRALVIGDTKQIEPIHSATPSVDQANLVTSGVIDTPSRYDDIVDAGTAAAAGNLMGHAQLACRHHQVPVLDRGLYLFDHWRCRDEIIGYCNQLCYHGRLIPSRRVDPSNPPPLPPLAFVHVDGWSVHRSGRSQVNDAEAQAVVSWLAEHKKKLEAHYQRDLAEIVAVVTPYRAHAELVNQRLRGAGFGSRGRSATEITVGTVHAMQGAERPVIVFSQVATRHLGGAFIDRSPNMLNVAVSRAQDSFVYLGDIDEMASAAPGTPRGALYRWMLDHDAEHLGLAETPTRSDLTDGHAVHQVINHSQHDALWQQVIGEATTDVHVVSPWLRPGALNEAGVLPSIADAVARDVAVTIYVDRKANVDYLSRDKGRDKARGDARR